MTSKGGDALANPPLGWKQQQVFVCLGHRISSDGSHWDDYFHAEQAAWKRFFIGAGSRSASKLTNAQRIHDIQVTCWPAVRFRCPMWAASDTMQVSVARLQRALVSACIREHRLEGETDASYFRRRARNASAASVRVGSWGCKFDQCVDQWQKHIC